MQRRKFNREFKLEAVKLVRERGVSVAQAARDVLTRLQTRRIALKPELRDFFALLLQNTKEGFFADPAYGGNYKMAGWNYIGFPGARGAYREWANVKGAPYPLGPVSISGDRG